jgi:hypothetical protein
MFCRLSNIKCKLLYIVANLDQKGISFFVNNSVAISYCYSIYRVKSVGFLFLVLVEVVFINYFWGYKASLRPIIDKYPALIYLEFYGNL